MSDTRVRPRLFKCIWTPEVCSSAPSRRRHTRFKCDWSSDVCFSDPSRRRHTRFKCDWSSDVCSSDLDSDNATYVQDSRNACLHFSDGQNLRRAEASDTLKLTQMSKFSWKSRPDPLENTDRKSVV